MDQMEEKYANEIGDEELREGFKLFDKDGDVKISISELKQIMMSLGNTLSEKQVEQMMGFADKERNGCLSYQGFKQVMTT